MEKQLERLIPKNLVFKSSELYGQFSLSEPRWFDPWTTCTPGHTVSDQRTIDNLGDQVDFAFVQDSSTK